MKETVIVKIVGENLLNGKKETFQMTIENLQCKTIIVNGAE
jgi:hypothetical protein